MGCCSSKESSKVVIKNTQQSSSHDDKQTVQGSEFRGEEKTDVIPMSPTTANGLVSETKDTGDSMSGTLGDWLNELGLSQYTKAFSSSGFDDLQLLATLNERDLDSIEAFSNTKILPGHRKKVLLASRMLAGTMAGTQELTFAKQADDTQESQIQLPGGVSSMDSPSRGRSKHQPSSSGYIDSAPSTSSSSSKPSTSVLADSLVTWLPPSHVHKPPAPNPPTLPPIPPLSLPPPISLAPLPSSQPLEPPKSPSPPRHRLPTASSPSALTAPPSRPIANNTPALESSKPSESQAVLDEVKAMIKQLSKRDKSPNRSQANRASAPASLLPATSSKQMVSSDGVISQKREELKALHGALENKVNMLRGKASPSPPPSPPPPARPHINGGNGPKPAAVLQSSPSVEASGISEIERRIRAKIEEVNHVLEEEEEEEEGIAISSKMRDATRAPSSTKSNFKRPSEDKPLSPRGSEFDVAGLVATRKKMKSLNEIDREIQAKLHRDLK